MRVSLVVAVSSCVVLMATSCSSTQKLAQFGDFEVTAFGNGGPSATSIKTSAPKQFVVRTTAYSHQEGDSLKYGKKSAWGNTLQYGKNERSAAADWSRFPVGTRFKIKGLPYTYVVDDYGSALVGTNTIDIYHPCMTSMKSWGTRNVGIEVLQWGSFDESMRILDQRKAKARHVREMVDSIRKKIDKIPPELRSGFKV